MHLFVYLLLCLMVGLLGRHRSVGFVGFSLIAFFLTPFVAIIILLLAIERRPPQRA
jgi:hypothetical protein